MFLVLLGAYVQKYMLNIFFPEKKHIYYHKEMHKERPKGLTRLISSLNQLVYW